jgi:3-deoxy-D-manno-octulosonic-acid transferase
MCCITGLIIYNLLALCLAVICLPFLLPALLFGGPKWRQRMGLLPCCRPDSKPIWVHGASVGEMGVIAPFLDRLKQMKPDAEIAISTMTATGQIRAAELMEGRTLRFFLPLDFLFSQLLALLRLHPRAVILTETELWPNLIWLCHLRGIPVFLINARLSQRSLPFYKAFGFLFGPLLSTMHFIACQSGDDAKRYLMLGAACDKVVITGNLKYDVIKGPVSDREKKDIRGGFGLIPEAVVFTAGSTREREEAVIIEGWQQVMQNEKFKIQNLKLIIAPRHPARFQEVEDLLKVKNFNYRKRSEQKTGKVLGDFDILLLDTIGELVNAYAASDLALVGGSLVPVGGHNPLEPAALGLPVLFGIHMFNAGESAEGLLSCGGAVQVKDARELKSAIATWLSDPGKRKEAGIKAGSFVNSMRGASQKTAQMVVDNLN